MAKDAFALTFPEDMDRRAFLKEMVSIAGRVVKHIAKMDNAWIWEQTDEEVDFILSLVGKSGWWNLLSVTIETSRSEVVAGLRVGANESGHPDYLLEIMCDAEHVDETLNKYGARMWSA